MYTLSVHFPVYNSSDSHEVDTSRGNMPEAESLAEPVVDKPVADEKEGDHS